MELSTYLSFFDESSSQFFPNQPDKKLQPESAAHAAEQDKDINSHAKLSLSTISCSQFVQPLQYEQVSSLHVLQWVLKFYGRPSQKFIVKCVRVFKGAFFKESDTRCKCDLCSDFESILDRGLVGEPDFEKNMFAWSKCLSYNLFENDDIDEWNEETLIFIEPNFVKTLFLSKITNFLSDKKWAEKKENRKKFIFFYGRITSRNAESLYSLCYRYEKNIYCAPLKHFHGVPVPLSLRSESSILTEKEISGLEKKYFFTRNNLPKIFDDDPLAIKLHAYHGQIIKTISATDTNKIPTLRLCIKQHNRSLKVSKKMTSTETSVSRKNRISTALQYY